MRSFQRLAPLFLAGFTGFTIASLSYLASTPLLAQQNPSRAGVEVQTNQQQNNRRVALVIGNSRYTNITPLQNPTNDARDMAAALRDLQFDRVIEVVDANLQGMKSALYDFDQELQQGGTGVFYYAGHGVQYNGENYLLPIEANTPQLESDLYSEALALDAVLGSFRRANTEVSIVILDACRSNPFGGSRGSDSQGLALVQAAKGMFIAYATAPGKVARDGEGRNGTFTEALLKHIRTPGLKVEELFKNVRIEVQQSTNDAQIPWESTSLIGDFAFNPIATSSTSTPVVQTFAVPTAPTNSQPSVALSTNGNLAKSAFDRGEEAYKNNNLEAAFVAYNLALESDPNFVSAYIARGNVYRRQSNFVAALQEIEQALRLDPNSAEAYTTRGRIYNAQENYDEAIRDFNRSINLNQNYALAYKGLGDVYYNRSDYKAALQNYSRAIELNPENAGYYNDRGDIYYDQNDYAAALREYSRAIELNPENAEYYYDRGLTYKNQKDNTAALRDFSRAIELDPKHSRAYRNRGTVQNNQSAALQDYNRAIELDPNFEYAYLSRGLIYNAQQDYTSALRDFNRVIELNPNNILGFNTRAIIYNAQNNYAAALKDLSRSIELNPNDPWAYSFRGALYATQNDYAGALRDASRAIELKPDPDYFYARGTIYKNNRQCNLAQQDYEQILRLAPNYQNALNDLREIQQMRQRGECRS